MPEVVKEYIKEGKERIISLAEKRIEKKDIQHSFSMVPFDVANHEVENLAHQISERISEKVKDTLEPDTNIEELQDYFRSKIYSNIQKNRGFLRHNMNLWKAVNPKKTPITPEKLLSASKEIVEKGKEIFIKNAQKQANVLRKKYGISEKIPPLNTELMKEIQEGKITTFPEFRSEIHRKNHLPREYRRVYNSVFNEHVSKWNMSLLNRLGLFHKKLQNKVDMEEAMEKWDKARDKTIHQLDSIVPFLNALKQKYNITHDSEGKILKPINITILNELRHMNLLELVASLESPIFNTQDKYSAQLIALLTTELIAIENHPKMKKLPEIKRKMDFDALSERTNIVKYAIKDKNDKWQLVSQLPTHLQHTVHNENIIESIEHPDQGLNESLDELTSTIVHPDQTPKVLNYRHWTPHGTPEKDVFGNDFKFHFRAIGSKTPDSIQRKLVTRKGNFEEIFDLARAAIVLDYSAEQISSNPALEKQVLSFAEDIGKNCLGLKSLVKKEHYTELLPGEFMIVNKLHKKKKGDGKNKNSSSDWKDIKIYGMGYDGIGREIQLLSEDTYCLDLDPHSPVSHMTYEIDRQLDYILQILPFIRYQEVHELIKAIKLARQEEEKRGKNIAA